MNDFKHLVIEFEKYHQHPINRLLHFICIPLIFISYLGLFHTLLMYFQINNRAILIAYIIFITPGLIFFVKQSLSLTLRMSLFLIPVCALFFTYIKDFNLYALVLFLIIFIFAWVGQLIGHKLENKKPAFTKDMIFLITGPLWVTHKFSQKINQKILNLFSR